MDPVTKVKQEIEQLVGISNSDSDMFWAQSKRCATLAIVPATAAGVKWGPGLVSLGTVTLPVLGTVTGTTAALLMMGGVWGGNYMACMSLLPGIMQFRDKLRSDPMALSAVRRDVRKLLADNPRSYRV